MIFYYFAILLLAYHANAQLKKKSILNDLRDGVSFLLSAGDLNSNAVMYIVFADAQMYYLNKTVEIVDANDNVRIKRLREKMGSIIDELKEFQPNEYAVKNLFDTEDWLSDGNYKFDRNRVSGPESTKSVDEIYNRSAIIDEACNSEMYANTKSDEERSCGISEECMNKMTNIEDEGPVPPIERVKFLSLLRYLKCSENPKNAPYMIMRICDIIYKEVLKLTEAVNNDKTYIFGSKVSVCASYGFTEFLDDHILKFLWRQRTEHGSIGNQNLEVQILQTAQYISIMASVYRHLFENV